MSNTKWRKLFVMLDQPGQTLNLEQIVVKFIDNEHVHRIPVPKQTALQVPWSFINLFPFGPVALSDIEWIEFPAEAECGNPSPTGTGRVPQTRVAQDIDRIEAIIAGLGRYPMERTDTSIRITGYVRGEPNLS